MNIVYKKQFQMMVQQLSKCIFWFGHVWQLIQGSACSWICTMMSKLNKGCVIKC